MERDGYDMRSKSNFAGCWVHFPVGGDTPQGCSGWWRHQPGSVSVSLRLVRTPTGDVSGSG